MSPHEKEVLMKLIGSGALMGTGWGLYSNLKKHHKLLKEQAELDEQARARSISPVSDFEKEAKGIPATFGGLGIAGGLGAGILSKKVIDKLYAELRKKELGIQLRDAEEAYTEALLNERDALAKTAGSRVRFSELIPAALVASLPIAMLGSGVATNQLLEKHFGPQPGEGGVSRLRVEDLPAIVADEERDEEGEELERRKSACWTREDDVMSHLLSTVCSFTKAAGLRDVLRAVALGRGPELEKVAGEHGIETMFDVAKGAENHPVDAARFEAAKVRLLKTASLRPSVEVLVAAEMLEHLPLWTKLASLVADQPRVEALGLMEKEAQLIRAAAFGFEEGDDLVKTATADRVTSRDLVEAMDEYLTKAANASESLRSSLTTDLYGGHSAKPAMESSPNPKGDDPSALEQPAKDPVDLAMRRTAEDGSPVVGV